MPGFPDRGSRGWAERLVAREGRPRRGGVVCVLEGLEWDAWRGLGRGWQEERLLPFLGVGEYFHCSGEGEVFIVAGGSDGSERRGFREVSVLRRELGERRELERVSRAAFVEGYARATSEFGPLVVELEREFLELARVEGASDRDRDRALRVIEGWKNRVMGRPVSMVEVSEDGGGGGSVLEGLVARGRLPRGLLPVSAGDGVEGVVDGEAGSGGEG